MELFGVGIPEAGLILVIMLLVVGPNRFPQVAREAGKWYRIARAYDRPSTVIYPPVDTDYFVPGTARREEFYLAASRFVPYKRTVETFADPRLAGVLAADAAAAAGRDTYDDGYFAAFSARALPGLEQRLNQSIAASAASTANVRCTMTSDVKSVVIHTRPGATRCRIPSLSSANAKSTITIPAKGRIWFVITRLRSSMRRSFAATARATRRFVRDLTTDHRRLRKPGHPRLR